MILDPKFLMIYHFHIYKKGEDNCLLDFEDLNVGKGYFIEMGIYDMSFNIIV